MSAKHDPEHEAMMASEEADIGAVVRYDHHSKPTFVCGDCGRSFDCAILDGKILKPDHRCLRDEFAIAALDRMIQSCGQIVGKTGCPADVFMRLMKMACSNAYSWADEMLLARKVREPRGETP